MIFSSIDSLRAILKLYRMKCQVAMSMIGRKTKSLTVARLLRDIFILLR